VSSWNVRVNLTLAGSKDSSFSSAANRHTQNDVLSRQLRTTLGACSAEANESGLTPNRQVTFRGQTSNDASIVDDSGVEAAHMRKRNRWAFCRKIVLRLPDLDHAKSGVLNSLSSSHSRRNYKFAMEQFITWYCSEPRLALNRTVVLRFSLYLNRWAWQLEP